MRSSTLLKAMLAAGGVSLLVTCRTVPVWKTTAESDAEFRADLRRCLNQPCEQEVLAKYGITSTRTKFPRDRLTIDDDRDQTTILTPPQ